MLELNELTPALMDQFIAEGALPNFARLQQLSTRALTDPEAVPPLLNPWVQWVTVHTGTPPEVHGIQKLGESALLAQPTIAEAVSDAGDPVWQCGAMNVPVRADRLRGAALSDPWSVGADALPAEFEPFETFVRANVQEHTNPAATTGAADLARFGWFLARHGLRARTARAALEQLVAERRRGRPRSARALVLDRMAWDVFRWYHHEVDPVFASFFANSTAHFQHHHWREHDPSSFEMPPSDTDLAMHADTIRSGYQNMDRLVGEAIDLAGEDTAIVFCSALGQQPYVAGDTYGGTRPYRARSVETIHHGLGLAGVTEVSPVMSGQFHLLCHDDAAARSVAARLEAASLEDAPAFSVRRSGADVFAGCPRLDTVDPDASIVFADSEHEVRFGDLFYRLETTKSGMHHPDGLLWIHVPGVEPIEIEERVPLSAIAPTVLGLLGIEPPESMRHAPVVCAPTGRR